jgi:sulfonate transport system permease protein
MTDLMSPGTGAVRSPRSPALEGALRGAAIPISLILIWLLLIDTGLVTSNLLVPLGRVLSLPFFDDAGRQLWPALGASIARLVIGFAIGTAFGILLGLLTGMSRLADRVISPTFNALRQITLFAWIPLLTAWFGNGDTPKVVYVALSAFFPTVLNTYLGLRNISPKYIEVGEVLHFSWRKRITHLLLPGALPSIFVGIQIALIAAWLGTVSSEYAMGLGRGLGTFLSEGRGQFRMDVVLLGVLVLALVGYLMNVACRRVFRRLLAWQDNAQ